MSWIQYKHTHNLPVWLVSSLRICLITKAAFRQYCTLVIDNKKSNFKMWWTWKETVLGFQSLLHLQNTLLNPFAPILTKPNVSSTVDLIEAEGYPSETHSVTTEDGYILSLHRYYMQLCGPFLCFLFRQCAACLYIPQCLSVRLSVRISKKSKKSQRNLYWGKLAVHVYALPSTALQWFFKDKLVFKCWDLKPFVFE